MSWQPSADHAVRWDDNGMMDLLPRVSRRLICRAIFLLLCVMPLAALCSWTAWRAYAFSADGYQRWLAAQLGLDAKIVGVDHPRPQVTQFEGLNLLDPENGDLIARCQHVEIHQGPERIGLILREVTVQPSHMQKAWEILHDRVLKQRRLLARPVLLVAATVKLPGRGSDELTDLRIDLRRTNAKSEAMVMFRPGSDLHTPLARIQLTRCHRDAVRVTRLDVDTQENALPLLTLAGDRTWLEGWGHKATFRGLMWWEWDSHTWNGECSGHLRDVQLAPLLNSRFPHEISGPAHLTIRTAVFRKGRLQSFAGRLEGGPGTISPSLVAAVCRHLGMRRAANAPAMENVPQDFRELTAELHLDNRGLAIRGGCACDQRGVVMMGAHKPALLEPSEQPQPVAGLVTALAGDAQPLVPATTNTRALIAILPLPSPSPATP